MKNMIWLSLFLASQAHATFLNSIYIADPNSSNFGAVNSNSELETFIGSDSNVCKETGGNLAGIFAELAGTIATSRTWTLNSATDSVTIAGSLIASNPSVGLTGSAAPASATFIGGLNSGNLKAPNVTNSGALQVDGSGATQPVSQSGVWNSRTQDGSGNAITSSTIAGGHQAIDVNAIGVSTATVGDLGTSGTITTTCSTPNSSCPAGSYVALSINGVASAQVQIAGTFSGASMNVDGSVDGINWVALGTSSGFSGQITTSAFSAASKYRVFRIAGFEQLRVRASSLSTGSIDIDMNASIGSNTTEAISLMPSNFLNNSYTLDGAGNAITSQISGSQRAFDIGIDVAGVQVDPRTRTWSLSSGTDSVSAAQSGAWTTGRTWTLSNTTDSVNIGNYPSIQAVSQSGTWNVNNISGTISLPTGAATSALQTTGNSSLSTIASNQTNASQKTQVVDGSGNVQGPLQAVSGTNYAPVTLAASGSSGSAVPSRAVQVGGSDGTNLRAILTDSTGVVQTSLGNTAKTIKFATGNLSSTSATSGQTVATYTVSGGKTFYLEEADCSVILNSAAATQSQFGTCQLLINGAIVWQQYYKGPGSASFLPILYYAEPIPVAAGQVITWQANPTATTNFLWYGNIGGYEK